MTLASDFWHNDFSIGQDQSDLQVWLRRPGSDISGDPPFVIPGVLQQQRWSSVEVILQGGDLRIDVDGRTRLTEHLPSDSPRVWSPGKSRSAMKSTEAGRGKARSAWRRCAHRAMTSITSVRARC